MPSIAFDAASSYYDATRGFAPGVAEDIRDAILAKIGNKGSLRFIELGVGTGRIALPFIQAHHDFTGVDLSLPMMAQLQHKLAADPHAASYNYSLLQADVTQLPFADASFDVALTVHVLHLVNDWQQTLREAYRVLRKPGGQLFICHEDSAPTVEQPPTFLVRQQWDAILNELGYSRRASQPGIVNIGENRNELIEAFLQQLGARTENLTLLEHPTLPVSPREMAERHFARMYSGDWQIPDAVHAEAVRRLEAWLNTECPEPDKAFSLTNQFKAIVANW